VERRRGKLEPWEVALIKAMIARAESNDQDILSYFTRPSRSVNHREIGEIRSKEYHENVEPAADEALAAFIENWPDLDPATGLSIRGDELLIKAREAMIAAVHVFNSAGLSFSIRAVYCFPIIAWTYLLHAWFKRAGFDYMYRDKAGLAQKTVHGGDRYWELSKCLRHQHCPLDAVMIKNLDFLIELRNEIEHRSTNRIDNAVSAKLQAT
jgi:hypothetical protein